MMELFYILMGVVVTGICTYVNIHRNVYLLPPSPPPRKFYCMIIKNKTKPQASLAEPFTLLPLLKCRNFTLPCFYLMLSLNFFTHSVTHSETFIGNFPGMKHFLPGSGNSRMNGNTMALAFKEFTVVGGKQTHKKLILQ